jgi:glycine/sarcosine N-methyltransferase
MSFYDDIADQYGSIVDESARRPAAERFVAELTSRYDITTALDVACGAGLYAIALSQAGVSVAISDLSQAMLTQAQAALPEGTPFHCGPMQEVSNALAGPFDTIVCMGNSLPHLLTDEDLLTTLRGFRTLLAEGGVLAIQLLNYDRVLAQGQRVVGMTRTEGKEYIRFYDFLGDLVNFNLLEIDWTTDSPTHQLHSTPLRPYRPDQLTCALASCNFDFVDFFSGAEFSEFCLESSETLLLIAR